MNNENEIIVDRYAHQYYIHSKHRRWLIDYMVKICYEEANTLGVKINKVVLRMRVDPEKNLDTPVIEVFTDLSIEESFKLFDNIYNAMDIWESDLSLVDQSEVNEIAVFVEPAMPSTTDC